MPISTPELSLIVLMGATGSGKSTFARKHFAPFEVVSSDFCRGLVANNENAPDANDDAFAVLHEIVRRRLARGLLTVVDATNVSAFSRKSFSEIAREFHVMLVGIVFDLPQQLCHERGKLRTDRPYNPHVIVNHCKDLHRSIRGLSKEGYRHLHVLRSEEEVAAVTIAREPLWTNRGTETGPFDLIGDVHGCYEELAELLAILGYQMGEGEELTPPPGRRAIFLGDLVDRGPATPRVLRLVMRAVKEGKAISVPGNHDVKLMRALRGTKVKIGYGLQESLDQLAAETPEFRRDVVEFIDGLISHAVLDDGKLVVAHAGLKENMQGRSSAAVRDFCLYGETTGETDEFGLPVRLNWAENYRGPALVAYGHTPVPEPQFLNNTVNIDTGCVFGGRLTAYRYPEKEIVSVPAHREYVMPIRPLIPPPDATRTAQQISDDLLHAEDVAGNRYIETRLNGRIKIRAENAAPALENISRFGVDPHWMIYLPPTMSPSKTSAEISLLEHPSGPLDYYREEGVQEIICEEKHMGSRAVVILCRDAMVGARRFAAKDGKAGVVYTKSGRAFFKDDALEAECIAELRAAFDRAGAWEELETDWVCLDCEIMPWSAKAKELLQNQYAPAGAAGEAVLSQAVASLDKARARGLAGIDQLAAETADRLDSVIRYREAYRHYCWGTDGMSGLQIAPFHIMATEQGVHHDRPHSWHMATIHGIADRANSTLLKKTRFLSANLATADSYAPVVAWWEALTASGGEGMVVKPMDFLVRAKRGVVQPAVKCRGPEYLRIIYGAEYLREAHLTRLRGRNLSAKRALASREFALGIEALERFHRREPLRRVHECVLGIAALESEAVDPRL